MGPLRLTVQTEPEAEPFSLAEIKRHLKLEEDDDTEDLDLLDLIRDARQYVEQITRRALINTTFDWYHDYFETCFVVPRGPLVSVSAITYTDPDGVTQTVDSSVYTVDTDYDPGKIFLAYNQSWPGSRADEKSVKIRFVAGYGSSGSSIPGPLMRAMKMLIGHWHENLEDTTSIRLETVPMGFASAIAPYRCGWF